MNIAGRIQNLRKAKGMSQEEFADKIGVSRQAVSKWESNQSTPDLDKIITISEYFDVTTDFILKGTGSTPQTAQKNEKALASQILFIASTACLAIGLFCAFGGWYMEQTDEAIWGGLIIQVVGLAGYFIGKLLSPTKAPFLLNLANLSIILFIPVSAVVSLLFHYGIIYPYPIGIFETLAFIVLYGIAVAGSFVFLKKRTKKI